MQLLKGFKNSLDLYIKAPSRGVRCYKNTFKCETQHVLVKIIQNTDGNSAFMFTRFIVWCGGIKAATICQQRFYNPL